MPLEIGDAILTFLGDTTQLDQTFLRVNEQVEATNSAAAMSTIALEQAQQELRAALAAVSAEGGNTVANIERLQQAEANLVVAAAAATTQHAALKEELLGTAQAEGIAAEASAEMSGALAGMFGLFAAFEGAKGFIEGVQKSVLQLELLSEKTGINISSLAGLQHVAESNGVSFDSVASALTRLSRAQALAIEGGTGAKAATTAFERLGISLEEVKNLTPEEMFFRVADAMHNATNAGQENASAFALLGRGGAALIPIFQKSGEELHKTVDEAGRMSGVTHEAGMASKEWEMQTANLAQAFRAGAIPAMELAIPVLKSVESAGSFVAMVWRNIGAAIGGAGLVIYDTMAGQMKLIDDVLHGNMAKAVADAKSSSEKVRDDMNGVGLQIEQNINSSADFIRKIWTEKPPYKPAADGQDDFVANSKKTHDKLAQEADRLAKEQARLEEQGIKDAEKLWAEHFKEAVSGLEQNEKEKIDATQQGSKARLAAIEAAMKEEKEKGLQELPFYKSLELQKVAFVRQAEAEKEKEINLAAERELKQAETAAKVQSATVTQQYGVQEKAFEEMGKLKILNATQVSRALELLYSQESSKLLKIQDDLRKEEELHVKQAQDKLTAAQENPFVSPQQVEQLKKVLQQAEQAVAATQQKIAALTKQFDDKQLALDKGHYGESLALATAYGNALLAEKLKENHAALLTAQGELAEAKARGVNTAAIQKEIEALKKNEGELIKDASRMKGATQSVNEFREAMKSAYAEEAGAFATAAEAMITGQESFGQAMEAATLKMLSNIAKHYAEVYIAKGLGNLADQAYGAAAEDFVAAAAFEAIAGALGGLGANVGKTGTTGSGGSTTATTQSAATTAGGQPASGVNVPHLAAGGLITGPTLAMLGEGSGSTGEAVIPLNDSSALRKIAEAFGEFGGGGGTIHNWNVASMISTTDLVRVARMISRGTQTGRLRVSVSNSGRVTRRV